MHVAVIGLGAIGSTIARGLASGGVSLTVAQHDLAEARTFAAKLEGSAEAADTSDAVGPADVVVLAIPFDGSRDLVAQLGDRLAGKVVVDPSNPIAPDGQGGFRKTLPQDQSSGQVLAGLLPAGAALVKAFGTLAAGSLAKSGGETPRAALFYAADDKAAGAKVAELITAAGFAPVDAGGLDQCVRLEVFGELHEMGGIGHVPTESEARSLVGAKRD